MTHAFFSQIGARCGLSRTKGPATRNDIVDVSSSTMAFNVAKIASARASLTISLTKSLRVAWPQVTISSTISLTMRARTLSLQRC